MKELWIILVACGFYFSPLAFSLQGENRNSSDLKVMNILNITQEEITKFMQEKSPEVILEFSKNTSLPLRLFLEGNFLHLNKNEQDAQIEVKQTFYVRFVQDEWIFSSNLKEWQPFLEFITGTLSFSLDVQDQSPFLSLTTEANLRS